MKCSNYIFLIIFSFTSLYSQESTWELISSQEIGINSAAINCIAQDQSKQIWLGTIGEGVFFFDGIQWRNYNKDNSPLPTNWITSIAIDSNNVKWIGTFGNTGGLTRIDGENWKVYNLEDYGVFGNTAYDIKIDKKGTFWMGSYWNGLIEFDGDSTFQRYNSDNTNLNQNLDEIISVNVQMDSVIICGSELGGAAMFNRIDTTWTHFFNNTDLVINSIELDAKNSIWFAGNHYISRYDQRSEWDNYNYDSSYYAKMIVNKDNTIYFSTRKDGLLLLNSSNEEEWEKIITPFDELTDIGCDGLFQDLLYNIWIGYNNGNLAVYNSEGITSIKNGINERLEEFTLYQNYPNPFNNGSFISYSITNQSQVELKIFDILGREVAELVNIEQPTGSYKVQFDASNLVSGVYFYRLKVGSFQESKKMVLMK